MQYEKINMELEEAMLGHDEIDEDNIWDSVLPEVQHQEEIDANDGPNDSQTFGCFHPGECDGGSSMEYDLGQDLGLGRKQLDISPLHLNEVPDDLYRKMVQDLNEKQKEFFYHVLHWMKAKTEPLRIFLTGGAGVGNSCFKGPSSVFAEVF